MTKLWFTRTCFRIIMENDLIKEKLWNDTSIPVDDPLQGTIIVISNDLLFEEGLT